MDEKEEKEKFYKAWEEYNSKRSRLIIRYTGWFVILFLFFYYFLDQSILLNLCFALFGVIFSWLSDKSFGNKFNAMFTYKFIKFFQKK